MLTNKERITWLFCFILLTGCAISPDASKLARQNQWEVLGHEDGRQGNSFRTQVELQRLGKTEDTAINDYAVGYSTGLAYFCGTENAYLEGITGRPYEGQCNNMPNEKEFIVSWQVGMDQYEFEVLDRLWQDTENDRYDDLMEEYTQEMN